MYRLSGIVAILVLLNFFQLHNAKAELKSFREISIYPQKKVMYNDFSIKEGNMIYAICNEDGPITEKICTIIQRQFPFDKIVHSCNITLQVKYPENYNLASRVWAYALGQEYAILDWSEMGPHPKFYLMTIQMRSCNKNIFEVDDPNRKKFRQDAHKLLTYTNYFDIFHEGMKSRNESAKKQVGMRVCFDKEPQPIYDIIKNENKDNILLISSIATHSPDKGFVYSANNRDNDTDTLTLVKPDGSEKILMNYEGRESTTSANYDMITSCFRTDNETNIRCRQYNENGEVKFEVNLEHNHTRSYETMTVHTTPQGGFLLVTVGYYKSHERVNDDRIISYDVVRIDSKGIKKGSIRLNYFVPDHYNLKVLDVWENESKYCIALVSQTNLREEGLQIAVNCFSDSDFSA